MHARGLLQHQIEANFLKARLRYCGEKPFRSEMRSSSLRKVQYGLVIQTNRLVVEVHVMSARQAGVRLHGLHVSANRLIKVPTNVSREVIRLISKAKISTCTT
jgi:hypothetical protein